MTARCWTAIAVRKAQAAPELTAQRMMAARVRKAGGALPHCFAHGVP